MSLGLSPILDTIDTTPDGQRGLFGDHWDAIVKKFADDYKAIPLTLPDIVTETIGVIKALCSESCRADDAYEYIYSILATPLEQKERNLMKILETILDILQYDREYVASSNDKLTEQDYQSNIWSPILRHLFRSILSRPSIRIKAGESIFQYTTDQKKHHYSNNANVVGYKIDLRIIADVKDKECDIGASEIAKSDTVKKIIDDEAKLLREGKDVIDHLAQLSITSVCPMAWLIQIANCQCQLSSIHLAADGLYVAVPQFEQLALPKSFSDMGCLATTLQALYTMEDSLRKMADLLPAAYARKERMGSHLGHESAKNADYIDWTRGTFYTPPAAAPPRLPDSIFKRRPSDLISKLMEVRRLEELPQRLAGVDTTGLVPDKYGWVYVPGLKKFYNVKTKVYKESHPFDRKRTRSTASSSSSKANVN